MVISSPIFLFTAFLSLSLVVCYLVTLWRRFNGKLIAYGTENQMAAEF